jgi:NAD(P)-dependent dehydrogenase (short-subunit alcohol dehydrogenase family)
MTSGLDGKTAVVAGGPSVLGDAVSDALAAAGASVTRFEPVATAAETRAALGRVGAIDVLVAIPTFRAPPAGAAEASETDWDAAVGSEARNLWLTVKEGAIAMQGRGGTVVVLAPEIALAGVRGASMVGAVAGALFASARALAIELAPAVRLNLLAYGCVEGDPYCDWFIRTDPQQTAALDGAQTLLGRSGSPAEVARAAAFLASDRSSFVHGHTLVVDGGYLVR